MGVLFKTDLIGIQHDKRALRRDNLTVPQWPAPAEQGELCMTVKHLSPQFTGVKSSFGGVHVNTRSNTRILLSWTVLMSHVSIKVTKSLMGGNPDVGKTVEHFNRRKTAGDILRQHRHRACTYTQAFAFKAGPWEQQGYLGLT